MANRWIFAFASLCLGLVPYASAQGVFDLGEISRQMNGAGTDSTPPPATPERVDAYDFTVSTSLRQENQKKFVNMLASMDPSFASQMEGVDLIELIGQEVAKYELSTDNFVDAYTIYFITAYDVVHGIEGDSTQAEIDGTRAMVLSTMETVGAVADLSDTDKQSSAEGLLLQAVLYEAISSSVADDPALQKKVQGDVKSGALAIGLDVTQFNMTANGLVHK